MLRIILILIVISIPTLARASDWKYIGTDISGNAFYVDTESVLIDGDTRTLWEYVILKEPSTIEDKIFYKAKAQHSINCAKRTSHLLVVNYLDSKGIMVYYGDYRAIFSDDPIIPDTIEDLTRKYVCSIKKSAE